MNRVLDRATPVLRAVGTKEATMMFKPRTMVAIQEEGGGSYWAKHILMGGGLSFVKISPLQSADLILMTMIRMNMTTRVQPPGHDSSKNGQLAMFRSHHLRVVCHPGQLSDHDADQREDTHTSLIFQNYF